MGYFIKKTNVDNEGFVLPAGPTLERPSTPITGSIRYNTDTQGIEFFNGTAYVEMAKAGRANIQVDKFTGDGVTTVFTPMAVEHTSWQEVLVFVDGYLQIGPGNYDVSGFNLTFSEAPPNGLRVIVIHGLGSTYVPFGNEFDVPNL